MSLKDFVNPNPDANFDENWVLHPAADAARDSLINSFGLSLMFERRQLVAEVLINC